MIPLYDLLLLKYPSITIGLNGNVQLCNHGNGDEISNWEVEGTPQPSLSDINTWQNDTALQQQYQFKLNKIMNENLYAQLEIIDSKSIRALRTNDTNRLTALEQQAIAIRAKLLPVE